MRPRDTEPSLGCAEQGRGGRVLLVHLAPADQTVLRSALASLGCQVMDVASVSEGLAWREAQCDLLVLEGEAGDSREKESLLQECGAGPEGFVPLLLIVSTERPEAFLVKEATGHRLDYAVRPLRPDEVRLKARTLIALHRAAREREGRSGSTATELLGAEWAVLLRREREDRARAEALAAELQYRERRWRSLIEATTQIVWTLNWRGEVEEDSPSWRAFTGQSFEECRGTGYLSAIHPEDLKPICRAWAEAICKRHAYMMEYRLRHRDGSWRHVLSRGLPVVEPDGRVREWVGWLVDVTRERRSEAALRESEEQFRAFFNLAAVGLAQTDPVTGRFLRVNEKFRELSGYSAEELGRMTLMELTHPEDREESLARFARMVRGETPAYMSERYVRKDGQVAWVEVAASVVRDAEGKPLRTVVVVQDVTARKQVEEEHSRLAAVVESSSDFIGIFTQEGLPLYVNPAGRRLVGLENMDEVRRGDIIDYIHPADRELFQREIRPVLVREGRWASDLRFRHFRTGRAIPMQFHAFLLRDADTGQPIGLATISRDITARRRGEERLAFLAEASRTLAVSLDDAHTMLQRLAELAAASVATYCIVDMAQPEGGFVRVAVAHRDPARSELMHQTLRFAPTPEGSGPLAEVARTGRPRLLREFEHEARSLVARGPEHRALLDALDAHSAMAVALTSRGQVLGVISFASCEEERPYEEEDLAMAEELAHRVAAAVDNARLYQKAQEAVRLRDEFLSVASHELKTPLTPLSLKLQGISRAVSVDVPGPVAERVRRDLDVAQRQVRRLTELINGLLDVSRITAGRMALQLETFDLRELVREVVSRMEPQAARSGSRLLLWTEEAVVGCWDRFRLEQVVTNLLSNALKYGAGLPVHLRVEASEGLARLVVRDEGIGIEPQALARIFEKFERAVSERHYGGLGLGLYITRQIIEAHGGHIRVESAPGKGASFLVTLPRQVPAG